VSRDSHYFFMTARCFMIKRQSVCKSGLWLGGFLMTAGTHHLVLCPARKVFFITTGTHHLALCLARALLRRPTPPRHGRNAQAPLSLQDSLSSVLQESWWQILKSACIVAWLFTRVCGCVCSLLYMYIYSYNCKCLRVLSCVLGSWGCGLGS
jgi:hypothetical protein